MPAQGWYPDPYGSHDDRWFSDGEPTSLVRDHGTESYDEPPLGQLPLNPLDRDESPPEGLPRYPPGPAREQEWLTRERRAWHWWTVCVPGVLALAVTSFILVIALLISVMDNCFDTCGDPGPPAGESALIYEEVALILTVFTLLAAGLIHARRRRIIASALWGAIVLAIALLLLQGS